MSITRFNYLFLFLFINWHPFQLVLLKQKGIGYIIVGLAMIALVLNIFLRGKDIIKAFSEKPAWIWLALIIYTYINWLFKEPPRMTGMDKFTFFYGELFSPLIVMIIVLIEVRRDYIRTLSALFVSFLFFVVIGTIFAEQDVNHGDRMLASSLGNMVPLNAVVALFLFFELKRNGKYEKLLLPIVFFLMFAIFLSSTRKALGASLIVIIGYVISRGNVSLQSKISKMLIILVIVGVIYYVALQLDMGERLAEGLKSEESIKLFSNTTLNSFALMVVGDRASQYLLALELIPSNFWTGIALKNFMELTGFPVQLHTEYMVQFCENGIIGFLLFAFVYILLIKRCVSLYMKDNKALYYLFGVLALLFINFTSWTYNMNYAICMIAIIIYKTRNNEIKQFKTRQLGTRILEKAGNLRSTIYFR